MHTATFAVLASSLVAGPGDDSRHTAEPWLAVRTGLACSACHTNVTGGGNRNAFGNVYAQTQLPFGAGSVVNKAVAEFLSVGFDLRAEGVAVLQGDPEPRTAINLDVAQVYLSAQFLDERVQLYVDQTVGPDRAVAREAFAMVRRLPLAGYAKAGKFLLPYGLRIQDDDEYIRSQTGIGYFSPEQGLEVGVEPGPLAVSVAITNGAVIETNSAKRLTGSAAFVQRRFRVGVSGSLDERPGAARRELVGGFAGAGVGPLALLGEVDLVRDRPDAAADPTREQLLLYGEGNWLVRRGVNLKVTHGWHDPDRDLPENHRTRTRFGVELFPIPFVRLAAFYALLQDPQAPGAAPDRDRVSVEAHLHF